MCIGIVDTWNSNWRTGKMGKLADEELKNCRLAGTGSGIKKNGECPALLFMYSRYIVLYIISIYA